MNRFGRTFALIVSILISFPVANATVTLPAVFGNGMVLQRNLPIHVWGKAAPGEHVSVSFHDETRAADADELGRWQIYLPPVPAGGPFELTVKASNRIVLTNILVGDVWLASGQSNMEFPMRELANPQAEISAAKFPDIRIMRVKHGYSEFPLDDAILETSWSAVTPESVSDFSAVAYYFAREIREHEKVPIGIIESSWGGTVAEAWTSLDALSADASLLPVFAARARTMDHHLEQLSLDAKRKIDEEKARQSGKTLPPVRWNPPKQQMWAPAQLYNAMIAPLTPFAIRGVIWYQGESNSSFDRAPSYARLFQTLIADWRTQWGEGQFPFLYVQIANYISDPRDDWPTIREAQRRALALRNTAMAVTIDIGSPGDIHPKDKLDVGHRLALAARALSHGEQVEYSGPLFRQVTSEEHSLRVWFDHAGGLESKNGPPTSFEVAGADGKFLPAEARIDGETVVVSSTAVPSPVAVRYGWANNPTCNLFNRAGLPASPFTSQK